MLHGDPRIIWEYLNHVMNFVNSIAFGKSTSQRIYPKQPIH